MIFSTSNDHLPAFISKMQKEGLKPLVINTFASYYHQVVHGKTGLIYDRDIRPVDPHEIKEAGELTDYAAAGRRAFKQTVRIILNGGLGTSMGLTGPKSLIEVKDRKSFLEILLRQVAKDDVHLALMNSFSTHDDTMAEIARLKPSRDPLVFLQHKFPKIFQKDLSPAAWPINPALEWNPPGHGDVYTALRTSGMLDQLLEKGVQYAFISNSDNLGARLEDSILGYFAENRFSFMMEVAEKTPVDIKGGHLARQANGRFLLRESAQCPKEELHLFQNIQRYRFFNTNNIWIHLESLKTLFEQETTLDLPLILNPKSLDPRDENSPRVFQVETAMGSAISLFEKTSAVNVPRTRFLPVKTCNDLLVVRSDCFIYGDDENLRIHPDRLANKKSHIPTVKLDPRFYGKIDQLDSRFKIGVPSLVNCDGLTIEGDVLFEKNVTIKGDVRIKNQRDRQAVIREGTLIDGDLTI